MQLHNGKERDADDWAELLTGADNQFQLLRAVKLPGTFMGLIEAVWTPHSPTDPTPEDHLGDFTQ